MCSSQRDFLMEQTTADMCSDRGLHFVDICATSYAKTAEKHPDHQQSQIIKEWESEIPNCSETNATLQPSKLIIHQRRRRVRTHILPKSSNNPAKFSPSRLRDEQKDQILSG